MIRCLLVSTALLGLLALLPACPSPTIVPLIGEDPEVGVLIGAGQADDPASSPMAAARRLHQALLQKDTELAWTLLSDRTRQAMNARADTIGVGGRELLDSSTLPDDTGQVARVRYDEVLFGGSVVDLELAADPSPDTGRAVIRMITRDGKVVERTFVLDSGDWKLEFVEFQS